jgi:hypothetical protein
VILHDGAFFGGKRRVTKGSVAFADDRIYYRTEEGPSVLVEPSRKEFLERGRFDQSELTDKPVWAHRVIAMRGTVGQRWRNQAAATGSVTGSKASRIAGDTFSAAGCVSKRAAMSCFSAGA